MRMTLLFLMCATCALSACATNPSLEDLDCDPGLGSCSAGLEPDGYDWYVTTDSDCALVTMESGEQLPLCGHRRLLGQDGEYGIKSCQVCVRRNLSAP
jgi:hypothetical protein